MDVNALRMLEYFGFDGGNVDMLLQCKFLDEKSSLNFEF